MRMIFVLGGGGYVRGSVIDDIPCHELEVEPHIMWLQEHAGRAPRTEDGWMEGERRRM